MSDVDNLFSSTFVSNPTLQVPAGDVAQTFKQVFCLMLSSVPLGLKASWLIFKINIFLYLHVEIIPICYTSMYFFSHLFVMVKKLSIWIWKPDGKRLWLKRCFNARLQQIFCERMRVVWLRFTTIFSIINLPHPCAVPLFYACTRVRHLVMVQRQGFQQNCGSTQVLILHRRNRTDWRTIIHSKESLHKYAWPSFHITIYYDTNRKPEWHL